MRRASQATLDTFRAADGKRRAFALGQVCNLLIGVEVGIAMFVAAPEGFSFVRGKRPAVAQTLGQVRVGREPAGESDEIRVPFVDDFFGLRSIETAGRDDRAGVVLAHEGGRDGLAVFVQCRIALDARIDDVEISNAQAVQSLGEPAKCDARIAVMNVAPLPLGRETQADTVGAENCGQFSKRFEQKARPVLDRSAVCVGSLVGALLEKLVDQVAIGSVQLDAVEAGIERQLCGAAKIGQDTGNLFDQKRTEWRRVDEASSCLRHSFKGHDGWRGSGGKKHSRRSFCKSLPFRARIRWMILEDAHWTDPTSLELFGRVVDRIASLRVLLIVTFRPEFEQPWIGRPYVTALTINRLVQREVDALIDGVIGSKLIPANIRQDIIERTDGIPLFVEEMTKAVLEAEGEGALAQAVSMVPSPASAVPASLHASLMARLDRLGSAKEVAQIGAVIGREFSHAVLVAVARKPEGELQSALDRLMEAGLLFRPDSPLHASYLFKHALVQDAAYGTLLREPRRALHARIAETLESQFAEIAESQPALLARHCTEAGLIEKAVDLWGKAGLRSLERSALVEAAEQITRALDQIVSLPSTPALRREQIKLQVAHITSLIHVKGYAAPETKAATEHVR
jgi:hypothetical protein